MIKSFRLPQKLRESGCCTIVMALFLLKNNDWFYGYKGQSGRITPDQVFGDIILV